MGEALRWVAVPEALQKRLIRQRKNPQPGEKNHPCDAPGQESIADDAPHESTAEERFDTMSGNGRKKHHEHDKMIGIIFPLHQNNREGEEYEGKINRALVPRPRMIGYASLREREPTASQKRDDAHYQRYRKDLRRDQPL